MPASQQQSIAEDMQNSKFLLTSIAQMAPAGKTQQILNAIAKSDALPKDFLIDPKELDDEAAALAADDIDPIEAFDSTMDSVKAQTTPNANQMINNRVKNSTAPSKAPTQEPESPTTDENQPEPDDSFNPTPGQDAHAFDTESPNEVSPTPEETPTGAPENFQPFAAPHEDVFPNAQAPQDQNYIPGGLTPDQEEANRRIKQWQEASDMMEQMNEQRFGDGSAPRQKTSANFQAQQQYLRQQEANINNQIKPVVKPIENKLKEIRAKKRKLLPEIALLEAKIMAVSLRIVFLVILNIIYCFLGLILTILIVTSEIGIPMMGNAIGNIISAYAQGKAEIIRLNALLNPLKKQKKILESAQRYSQQNIKKIYQSAQAQIAPIRQQVYAQMRKSDESGK